MGINVNDTGIVILAAGKGTRMKSDKAKVLHEICGRPMISYVVDTSVKIAEENIVVVIGHQAEKVKEVVAKEFSVNFAIQAEQLGTGHAVMCALPYLPDHVKHVIILCGDVPLISPVTINMLIERLKNDRCNISMLAVEIENPTGYGRVIVNGNGNVTSIVEEADSNAEEKKIRIINAGIYCVEKKYLEQSLNRIKADNAQGEYYLTDIIELGNKDGKRIGLIIGDDPDEVIGINDKKNLSLVEEIMKDRSSKILT